MMGNMIVDGLNIDVAILASAMDTSHWRTWKIIGGR